ncbi:MAG TPA: thiamine phosphate synthase [Gemmatimonadales bacterium]|nr:thiamine phosphate synthase [Gemmatimonadales bacterium]
MRPLPRVHAITDARVIALPDFAVRAAAIAAAGSAVALHARDREAGGERLSQLCRRLQALAQPAEATVFVNGRPDVAAALGAHGAHLAWRDLSPRDVRRAFGAVWTGRIGVSVHSEQEADQALAEGADYLMLGNIYSTDTHPGRPALGLEPLRRLAARGTPVIAIGGITRERLTAVLDAGAYGVAAVSALWHAADSATAVLDLLEPWAVAA